MSKKAWLVIGGILLAIIAGVVYLLLAPKQTVAPQQADHGLPQTSEPASQAGQPDPAESASQGRYIDYKPDSIAQTSGTKLLFFHAPWCPQCRQLDASIKAGAIPNDVAIIKIDYDTQQDLRVKYGVIIQTTIVRVDDAGNFIEKFVAYQEPTLAAVLNNLLQ